MNEPHRFETLLEQHHDEIYRYVWRMFSSAGWSDCELEAQDVTQDTFLKAYRAYGRLRPESNYRAWLYKIATNSVYSAMRHSKSYDSHNVPLLDEAHEYLEDGDLSPFGYAAHSETLATVAAAIRTLPEKQRSAVIMRHLQDLDYAEIAHALDCSEDSARANVYQAIRRLRAELVED